MSREVLGGTNISLSAIRIVTCQRGAPPILREEIRYFGSAQFSQDNLPLSSALNEHVRVSDLKHFDF